MMVEISQGDTILGALNYMMVSAEKMGLEQPGSSAVVIAIVVLLLVGCCLLAAAAGLVVWVKFK